MIQEKELRPTGQEPRELVEARQRLGEFEKRLGEEESLNL